MWAGWNETCYKDPQTGQYCNDVISTFTRVARVELMPKEEMCSYCYKTKLQMMQSSPYSYYNEVFQHNLEVVMKNCDFITNTTIPQDLVLTAPEDEPLCVSGKTYTTKDGDTCTSIALEHSVSSATLYMGNQDLIRDCQQVVVGKVLCIPLSCEHTYVLQEDDTCFSIERANSFPLFDSRIKKIITLRQLNPWINAYCTNLQSTAWAFGRVLCLSHQAGVLTETDVVATSHNPWGTEGSGYSGWQVEPPRNATLAEGTTKSCGKWHTALTDELCTQICVQHKITSSLFMAVNPSLDPADCTASLTPGLTYCTGPLHGWNYTVEA
ncbi:pectin lyase-like protein [Aspergillus terreus]|uniref:Pectin lyase-like protein n=1 Tax=Aspergillus terreus TaxID=33178 RepID=A0A5M3Z5Z9_ASPTE|nr:hypothetical protein ATETN484_0010022200 [Aspergillus terreus]GFF18269.1 pectin lyase-like protein [Aspergillus terreus]